MSNDVPWYVSLIAAWLPFFGAVAWHGRQIRKTMTTSDGRSLAQVIDDLVREIKIANDVRDGSRR